MTSWTFVNAESGQELCTRWQGFAEQAHALAAKWAAELGCVIEYTEHETGNEYDTTTDGEVSK